MAATVAAFVAFDEKSVPQMIMPASLDDLPLSFSFVRSDGAVTSLTWFPFGNSFAHGRTDSHKWKKYHGPTLASICEQMKTEIRLATASTITTIPENPHRPVRQRWEFRKRPQIRLPISMC
jgi:hypothetical protein